jgi:hypothetical protein
MKKVTPGMPFSVDAPTWNAFIDAAGAHQQAARGGRGGRTAANPSPVIIQVLNDTDDPMDRFSAVKLVEPVVTPEDPNEDEFLGRVVMKADTPDEASAGGWAVVQADLPPGEIGPAVVLGVTQAWIGLVSAEHTHVEAEGAVPASGCSGTAQILWVAGGVGTATATGEQWALIKLAGAPMTRTRLKITTMPTPGGLAADCKLADESGPEFGVELINYHQEDDYLWAEPAKDNGIGSNRWIEVGEPEGAWSQYMVKQISGSNGTWTVDWVTGHS